MICPFCNDMNTRVMDSRPAESGSAVRRRRFCDSCGRRFTTYERVEEMMFMVVKKDNSRELFSKSKVKNGIITACKKRPVTSDQIDKLVEDVERALINRMEKEIPSTEIGEVILENLKNLDEVAYVRFASVYRHFDDAKSFAQEIENLSDTHNGGKTDNEYRD